MATNANRRSCCDRQAKTAARSRDHYDLPFIVQTGGEEALGACKLGQLV